MLYVKHQYVFFHSPFLCTFPVLQCDIISLRCKLRSIKKPPEQTCRQGHQHCDFANCETSHLRMSKYDRVGTFEATRASKSNRYTLAVIPLSRRWHRIRWQSARVKATMV